MPTFSVLFNRKPPREAAAERFGNDGSIVPETRQIELQRVTPSVTPVEGGSVGRKCDKPSCKRKAKPGGRWCSDAHRQWGARQRKKAAPSVNKDGLHD